MNLFETPFYILGLNTRDSKQRVMEACDEKNLTLGSEICAQCRTMMTQPRGRITAEISWLPGVAPARAASLLKKIETEPHNLTTFITGLNQLVRCNILATYLSFHKPTDPAQVTSLLILLAKAYDEIDNDSLMMEINEDRHLAGVPLIQDREIVKDAIQEHRKYLSQVMKNALNNVKNPDIVFTEIVKIATINRQEHPPLLIDDLSDLYQIEVQKYLDKLSGQIKAITKDIQSHNLQEIDAVLSTLEKKVKAWDQIAQPIQLVMQSKGIEDSHSQEIANELRSTAIFLANELGMHEEAHRITMLMSEVFKELPQLAEKVFEDLGILEDMLERKTRSKEEEQTWRKECSLDVKFGTIFKKRLTITPEIIRFKNDQVSTKDVNRIRWGATATKHSVNYIPTGTSYSFFIQIGSNQKSIRIEPSDQSLYDMIVDRLWKAVCVRLLNDTLRQLSGGDCVNFGNGAAIVSKDGITLRKHKVFGRSEPYFAKWEELTIRNGNGTFIVEAAKDKSIGAELPYKDIDNVHIFEALLRFLWKDGNYQNLERGDFPGISEDRNKNSDTIDSKNDIEDELKQFYYDIFNESAFCLIIDDIFHANIGTVVTGKILKGALKNGDQIEILGFKEKSQKAFVKGIEMDKKLHKSAKQDDVIGVLLGGEDNFSSVKKGNILIKP